MIAALILRLLFPILKFLRFLTSFLDLVAAQKDFLKYIYACAARTIAGNPGNHVKKTGEKDLVVSIIYAYRYRPFTMSRKVINSVIVTYFI